MTLAKRLFVAVFACYMLAKVAALLWFSAHPETSPAPRFPQNIAGFDQK